MRVNQFPDAMLFHLIDRNWSIQVELVIEPVSLNDVKLAFEQDDSGIPMVGKVLVTNLVPAVVEPRTLTILHASPF